MLNKPNATSSSSRYKKFKSTPELARTRTTSLIQHKDNQIFFRSSNRREYRNQKKLTVSLIFILCSLLVCYFPSFLFEESLVDAIFGEFRYDLTDRSAKILKIKGLGTRISLALIYVNCSCNFLIYCISNERFKKALVSLFKLDKNKPSSFEKLHPKNNVRHQPAIACNDRIEIRL